jgi:hypothetical protein
VDESQWYRVEEYVRYVVRTWGGDPRVFLLDLYNEPANPWIFTESGTVVVPDVEKYEACALKLMEKVFEWARDEKPQQPLTVSAWHSEFLSFVWGGACLLACLLLSLKILFSCIAFPCRGPFLKLFLFLVPIF